MTTKGLRRNLGPKRYSAYGANSLATYRQGIESHPVAHRHPTHVVRVCQLATR